MERLIERKRMRLRPWLESTRPATLPLALASIICGSALAFWQGGFNLPVAVLALLTATLLQILSNLANDYGDASKGADDSHRLGPLRGMQKGQISLFQMKQALILCVLACAISGGGLIVLAARDAADLLGFALLGLLAIIAAITYSVGRYAYGYHGLGDLSVLMFFGWLGVLGSSYLQTGRFEGALILPATGCGLLAAAVLNLNNLRDIEQDPLHGKYTLAVRLGARNGRYYQLGLLVAALLCFALFAAVYLHTWSGWLFLLSAPLLLGRGLAVLRQPAAEGLRPMLGQTVKAVLLTSFTFAIGVVLSH